MLAIKSCRWNSGEIHFCCLWVGAMRTGLIRPLPEKSTTSVELTWAERCVLVKYFYVTYWLRTSFDCSRSFKVTDFCKRKVLLIHWIMTTYPLFVYFVFVITTSLYTTSNPHFIPGTFSWQPYLWKTVNITIIYLLIEMSICLSWWTVMI